MATDHQNHSIFGTLSRRRIGGSRGGDNKYIFLGFVFNVISDIIKRNIMCELSYFNKEEMELSASYTFFLEYVWIESMCVEHWSQP